MAAEPRKGFYSPSGMARIGPQSGLGRIAPGQAYKGGQAGKARPAFVDKALKRFIAFSPFAQQNCYTISRFINSSGFGGGDPYPKRTSTIGGGWAVDEDITRARDKGRRLMDLA